MVARIFACAVIFPSAVLWAQSVYRPAIPKTWDAAALADWATPFRGFECTPSPWRLNEGMTKMADPKKRTFSDSDLAAVVRAARGKKVAAHAHEAAGLKAAVEAGVSTIEQDRSHPDRPGS